MRPVIDRQDIDEEGFFFTENAVNLWDCEDVLKIELLDCEVLVEGGKNSEEITITAKVVWC